MKTNVFIFFCLVLFALPLTIPLVKQQAYRFLHAASSTAVRVEAESASIDGSANVVADSHTCTPTGIGDNCTTEPVLTKYP